MTLPSNPITIAKLDHVADRSPTGVLVGNVDLVIVRTNDEKDNPQSYDRTSCPVGIATQKKDLRLRLIIDDAAARLARFFEASVELMAVLARACGHDSLSGFTIDDLATFDRTIADLTGVP